MPARRADADARRAGARSPARRRDADGARRATRARWTDEEIIAGRSSSDGDGDGDGDGATRRAGLRCNRSRRRGRGGRGARILRVGGVEVVLDRVGGASASANAAVEYEYDGAGDGGTSIGNDSVRMAASVASEEAAESSDEDWSDGSSVDDDAAMDYAENARLRSGGATSSDEGDDGAFVGDEDEREFDEDEDESDARLARELRSIMNMNVEGGPPEPPWDSSDEEEIEARFAANASDDFDDDDDDAKWSRVIATAIDAGAAYVGCPTSLSLEDAARVAKRHDCALEVRGGGKRRHAIIHIDSAARREPRSTNVRGARASTKSTRGGPAKKTRRRAKPAVQFISGGVARDSDVFIDDDDDEDSRKKPSMEPIANGEPVVYPNRGARRAAEAQARDREFIEKARAKKRGTVVGAGHEYGAFEKHTTGFGSRMLAKMGFQGQGSGVGREGEGIAEPVTATTRGKRVGLGAFGAER